MKDGSGPGRSRPLRRLSGGCQVTTGAPPGAAAGVMGYATDLTGQGPAARVVYQGPTGTCTS